MLKGILWYDITKNLFLQYLNIGCKLQRNVGDYSKGIYALTGEGVPRKAYEILQREGSNQRTYLRPCNVQTLMICEASYMDKIIFLKLYMQDRSNHEKS